MKRLGLICNSLPATLFLALAVSAAPAQEVSAELLRALPPKPAAPTATPTPGILGANLPATTLTLMDHKESSSAARANSTQPTRARLLEMFDKNKDGRLDDNERAAAKKYAQDHGVRPDPQMRERMAKTGSSSEAMRTELRRRFDRNGNGKIDDDEAPAFEQAIRSRVGSAPMLRQRYDKNGDGKLDDKEWTAARGQIRQWVNERAK